MTRREQLEALQRLFRAIDAGTGEMSGKEVIAALEAIVRAQKTLMETPEAAFESEVKMELSEAELKELMS